MYMMMWRLPQTVVSDGLEAGVFAQLPILASVHERVCTLVCFPVRGSRKVSDTAGLYC